MAAKQFSRGTRGQAIVLMALLMIVILGFVGLAVDGGRYFLLRRDAQNAADSAASAAAWAMCFGKDWVTEGKRLATVNRSSAWDEVIVQSPPSTTVTNPEEVIEVRIRASIPSTFTAVLRIERLELQAQALGRCTKSKIRANNAALFAMSEVCQDSLMISGSQITVNGATVSNSDSKFSSSSGTFVGENFHYGEMQSSTGVSLTPGAVKLPSPVDEASPYKVADYQPDGTTATKATAEGMYQSYSGNLKVNTNPHTVTLEGLWYVDGDFQIIGDNYTVGPKGWTVVATGKIVMSATNISLKPYTDNLLLMSMEESTCGNNAITLSSSSATWTGIIYAPNGGVRFSDMGNSTENGGIIAQTISIAASNTNISRNPGISIVDPPVTYLAQ